MTLPCIGGPLDGKEVTCLPEPLRLAQLANVAIPICEGELEGMYRVEGGPLRLVYVGPLPT